MRRLFIILALVLIGCEAEQGELPILSYRISDSGEKEYYTIKYDGFEDQFGRTFNDSTLFNEIYLANFFFTRCPSICPPMRQAMINLAEEMDGFKIVSHTIDPEYDTSEVLNSYSEATGIKADRWIFLRSTEENTKALAAQFMTNFRPNEDGTDFYHSSYAALIDRKGNIRGFYNILIGEEITRLLNDIKRII